MSELQTLEYRGSFLNGQFVQPERVDGEFISESPADLGDIVLKVQFELDHIERACNDARKAFPDWSAKSIDERKNYLNRLSEVFQAHHEDIALIIARETGKPLWEAKTEANALVGKVNITVNDSIKYIQEERLKEALPGVDGVVRFKPRGVMAVVGPFNFPAHLPNGHIVPALLTGNTVVFKPSEWTPAVGQIYTEMIQKAEFPPGVFNLVQGTGEAGRRLVTNEEVDGVLFTGSYDVGLKIKQDTMRHYWKLLALEMGGKNATVIWDDADLDKAVYETLIGAYLTSGQRCSCTSRILVHKNMVDAFTERFYAMAKKLKIGHWSDNPFMGPLINSQSVERYIRFQEIARHEGAESIMRGKMLELDRKGYYVTPSIFRVPEYDKKSVYQKSEIFGPNVAILAVDDFDETIDIVNSTGYGLVMALFSKNKELYQRALQTTRVGLLNWNRTTNGASSRLPFGGMGKSGNDRPSGGFAIQYCTVPVASLEDSTGFDPEKILPGVDLAKGDQ